jgi:hypothetical protein
MHMVYVIEMYLKVFRNVFKYIQLHVIEIKLI